VTKSLGRVITICQDIEKDAYLYIWSFTESLPAKAFGRWFTVMGAPEVLTSN